MKSGKKLSTFCHYKRVRSSTGDKPLKGGFLLDMLTIA